MPYKSKAIKSLSILAVGAMIYIFFGASCLPKTSIPVIGQLFSRPFQANVDHDLAKLMLTNPQDPQVQALFEVHQGKPLNTETLAHISKDYSTDVATFYFLQRAYQDSINKEAQDLYTKYYEQQSSSANNNPNLTALQGYFLVFVPGLAYKEDTTTGADFARQRRLLTSIGIANELIEIGEWDLADVNAQLIAQRLRELSVNHEKIMVVSASKGGLETAIALGKIMNPEETSAIKAWINVGGILRGSPIADDYLKAPKCWLAGVMLRFKGKRMNIVQDMSYQNRKETFDQLRFPENIKIFNFVGAPLSNNIDREIRSRYCSMIKLGPNDGLTPLADEITNKGIVVSEPGLDHYFRDGDIDKKTLALALVAVTK